MVAALNPPFDPRMLDLGFWSNKKLDRGYFVSKTQAGNSGPGGQKDGKRINFLYNPSVLSFSHQTTTDLISPQNAPGGPNQTTPTLGYGTANFDLLFDRTYELWHGGGGKGLIGSASTYGTSVDAEAIRAYVGIRPENPTGINSSKDFQQMKPVFTHFFFGNGVGALRFYGYISNLSIEVTHWNQKMVPQRCAVSIEVFLTPYGVVAPSNVSTSPSQNTQNTGGGGSGGSGGSSGGNNAQNGPGSGIALRNGRGGR
jgi:hypothetical protein